jgi:hypothetical protein
MQGAGTLFIFIAVVLVVMGVIGYSIEKRRRGPAGVRRFVIWYVFAWPFMAVGVFEITHPRQHWLVYLDFGIAAVGYGVQFLDARRSRAALRRQAKGPVSSRSRTGP